MASSDIYKLHIRGRSAHCAKSAEGADALRTAVEIAAALPELRAEAEDPRTILFLGSIHAGKSHNVVSDAAELFGTLRTFSPEDRKNLKARLGAYAEARAAANGTSAEIEWDIGCPVVYNDEELLLRLQGAGVEIMEVPPTLAGEDFARYMEFAPGVMLWLGTGDTPPIHSPGFYVPEEVLPIGAELWQRIARTDWDA